MTNAEALAKQALYPHLSLAHIAYYAGYNSVDDETGKVYGRCEFSDSAMVAEYSLGVRRARTELRLNADTEWDEAA